MIGQALLQGWQLSKETVTRFVDNGGSLLAAALAFYSLLSMAPLAMVAIAIAGWVWGEETATRSLMGELTRYVGPSVSRHLQILLDSFRRAQPSGSLGGWAPWVGLGLLLLSASRLFGQMQDAISQLWKVQSHFKDVKTELKSAFYKKLLTFGLVFCCGILLIVFVILSTLVTSLKGLLGEALPGAGWLWSVATIGCTLGLMGCMVAALYRWLPEAQVRWRDAWAGAGVTALLFTVAEYPLSVYLAHQGIASAYGAAGSLVIFLLWVYYCAQIFFLGAQFTQVLTQNHTLRRAACLQNPGNAASTSHPHAA